MEKLKRELIITFILFLIAYGSILFNLNATITFLLILLALIKSSSLLGFATEEAAANFGGNAGGLLNATFGNLAELIIGFFAIKEGLVEVVKASITGSIIGNALLVFGMAIIAGSLKRKELKINEKEIEVNSTMMLLAVLLFLFPSLLFIFHEETHAKEITLITAFFLMLVYIASIVFSFITHKDWFFTHGEEKASLSKKQSIGLMLFSVVLIVILSESFAGMIEEIGKSLNLNELFMGAIVVGVVGNAAEHLTAIEFSRKNKMSLVMNTTVGSSLQIAMFVVPLLVFSSFAIGHELILSFLPIEIISIVVSVLLLNEVYRDKRVNWLEGMQLIVLYLIIAVLFYFYTG